MNSILHFSFISFKIMIILLRFLLIVDLTLASFLFFDRDSYEFSISETTSIQTRIGRVHATSSSSLSITYVLHNNDDNHFQLDPNSGELRLILPLDYETMTGYTFTIEARPSTINLPDSIAPVFAELTIHVLNVNDNAPDINLFFYPSVLIEPMTIKYDIGIVSTPFATVNVKDLDSSTQNLTVQLNDTERFQLQFVRQSKNGGATEAIYILSTKTNNLLLNKLTYYLSINACDNDEPSLWTNRSFELQFKSNVQSCNFSFDRNEYILDVSEQLTNGTLLMRTLATNCYDKHNSIVYSIDDTDNFRIDSYSGDLFTTIQFDRQRQSLYFLQVNANDGAKQIQTRITIRILDEQAHLPFLLEKFLSIDRQYFSSVPLSTHEGNVSVCRHRSVLANYFRLFANCTLVPLSVFSLPPPGRYLLHIQLVQQANYDDTFILDLTTDAHNERLLIFVRTQWIIILPILLGILFVLVTIICAMMILRRRRHQLKALLRHNQTYNNKQNLSPSSPSSSMTDNGKSTVPDKNHHNKYDALSMMTTLKVHDDHELSPSPNSTAIYLVQRPSTSPPLSSSSPAREDEGYSGSSDVSDSNPAVESTILAAGGLFEQYRIHKFHNRQSMSPSYDVPRRFGNSTKTACVSPDVSLV